MSNIAFKGTVHCAFAWSFFDTFVIVYDGWWGGGCRGGAGVRVIEVNKSYDMQN